MTAKPSERIEPWFDGLLLGILATVVYQRHGLATALMLAAGWGLWKLASAWVRAELKYRRGVKRYLRMDQHRTTQ